MVKTVPLTKGNTAPNYKGGGVKMDRQTIFNCIQGGQLLRAGEFNPSDPPPPDKYSPGRWAQTEH